MSDIVDLKKKCKAAGIDTAGKSEAQLKKALAAAAAPAAAPAAAGIDFEALGAALAKVYAEHFSSLTPSAPAEEEEEGEDEEEEEEEKPAKKGKAEKKEEPAKKGKASKKDEDEEEEEEEDGDDLEIDLEEIAEMDLKGLQSIAKKLNDEAEAGIDAKEKNVEKLRKAVVKACEALGEDEEEDEEEDEDEEEEEEKPAPKKKSKKLAGQKRVSARFIGE